MTAGGDPDILESGCLLVLGAAAMFASVPICAIGGDALHNKACVVIGIGLLLLGIVIMIIDVTYALDRSRKQGGA